MGILNSALALEPLSLVDSSSVGIGFKGHAGLEATLSEAVRIMYNAAKDTTQWPSALQRVCRCLGGSGLAVIIAPRGGGSPFCIAHGMPEDRLATLKSHLMRGDASLSHVVAEADGIRAHEYPRAGNALKVLADPTLGRRQLIANLDLQTAKAAFSVLYRTPDETPFDAGHIESYAALVPHIEQALALSHHIAELAQRSLSWRLPRIPSRSGASSSIRPVR